MDVCSSGSLAPFCHFVVHAHRVIPKTLMTPEVCLPASLPTGLHILLPVVCMLNLLI
jgi:hypothetical protein